MGRFVIALVLGLGAFTAAESFNQSIPLFQREFERETFVEPILRRSQNGVLSTTLEMKLAKHRVAGRTFEAATYEGVIPAPTLLMNPGDRLRIRFINNLTVPGAPLPIQRLVSVDDVFERSMAMMRGMHHETMDVRLNATEPAPDPQAQLYSNIHTHGLQVSPVGNGDNPFLLIKPGETFDYDIPLPADDPSGFDWYHPHKHGSTAKQTWAGVAGGIIVKGDIDKIPAVAGADSRVMILQELWMDNTGHVPAALPIPVAGMHMFSTIPPVPSDILYVVNGIFQPTIDIRPGQTQRWRIVNAAPHRFFMLKLDGHTMYQIAQDGITLTSARPQEQILVAPGNRVEVIIRGGRPGRYKLRALEYDQGHPGGAMPEDLMGTVISRGDAVSPPGLLPTTLLPNKDLTRDPIAVRRTIVFKGSTLRAPVEFFLDGKPFDPDRDDVVMQVDRTEEWTLKNEDVMQHPFHIHVNPFQVVEINGTRVPDPIWWDTFALPPKGEIKILMHPRPDVTGRTVYHCHILPHEDNGMMSAFSLVPRQ
jgi:FtsP/CotA-like multicopper oxidase with cupredoxin domain